jgi:nitronate monooxygenase
MAGVQDHALTVAVSRAGGLGSLPCALFDPVGLRRELQAIREAGVARYGVNFFCHRPPTPDAQREAAWLAALAPFYEELGIDPSSIPSGPGRLPFGSESGAVLEEFRPPIVSFHFGLPNDALLARVRATGALVIGTATTVREALWLERHGADAIVAQGLEAGGHRGIFLETDVDTQVGTFALVPQIVRAVRVPVIAAGGIADRAGVEAAMKLGASAVQVGTAYLLADEAKTSAVHRQAIEDVGRAPAAPSDRGAATHAHAELVTDATPTPAHEGSFVLGRHTALTNLYTGGPARGIVNRLMQELGPMSPLAPPFPLAASAVAPLRAEAERRGLADFSPLWAGQSASGCRAAAAGEITRDLAGA